jgi:hypothetical protein
MLPIIATAMDIEKGPHSTDLSVAIPVKQQDETHGDSVIIEFSTHNTPDSLSSDEEKMLRFILETYFSNAEIPQEQVSPFLIRRIRQTADSPTQSDRDTIIALRQLVSGEELAQYPLQERYLQALVMHAAADAIYHKEKEERKELDRVKKEHRRKKAKIIAAITALGSSLITASVALIVNYTSDCQKS